MYTFRVCTRNLHNHWFVLRYHIRIVSVCFLDAAMYTPAYLHTFIGCDKTPVFTQALKIQKLNERNDVQYCVLLLVVALHTWITHGRHCHTPTYSQRGVVHMADNVWEQLQSVSWPQKGCCDYISQRLVILVVQHHGVSCVHWCPQSNVPAEVKGCHGVSSNR